MPLDLIPVSARDGLPLCVRVGEPVAQAGQGGALGQAHHAVLIAPAMGVPQRFYAAFAAWLQSQGVAVMSFDWRGVGEAAPPSLRGYQASISEWAELDLPAVVDAFCARWPQATRTYLGHSLGGQLFGCLDAPERFHQMLSVASGSGYWRFNAPGARRKAPWLWWLLAPVSIGIAGFFPGKRLRVMANVPAAAMWQWRRWCLHPDYLGAEGADWLARHARVRTPITALILEDDELLSPAGIRDLYRLYPQAPVRFESLGPAQFGLKRIGHLGLFQSPSASTLWPLALRWIEAAPV